MTTARCFGMIAVLLVSPFLSGDEPMQIEKTYFLSFPLSVVYVAWVSSDTVIAPATSMDVLPEVGGHYRLLMETPTFVVKNEGEFLLVEPESRVTYTWEWNQDGEVTTIDVRFNSVQSGTRIELLHTGFTKEDSVNNHDSGWDNYIAGLVNHLENTPGTELRRR